ncbi:MAG: hypothetical protein IKO98_07545 [Bacteroidales bacterium]|nr:hypothetical protein [Bacteroidales bacterium]
MKHFDDINDDEIRVIGGGQSRRPSNRNRWLWVAVAGIVLLILGILLRMKQNAYQNEAAEAGTLPEPEAVSPTLVQAAAATVLVSDTTINDVQLRLHFPVNAVPELRIGIPDTTDPSLLMALQAADIRADNGLMVGAFVLKGELMSRGMSKKGFCAILGDEIHIGMAESTPLFEESIEKEGGFFRQYPLVCDGKMVENKPKGKAVRHALCEIDGQVAVVSSLSNESMHDFAQALEDMGVRQAIYLTGADSYGFCRPKNRPFTSWGNVTLAASYGNVNFIVWKSIKL